MRRFWVYPILIGIIIFHTGCFNRIVSLDQINLLLETESFSYFSEDEVFIVARILAPYPVELTFTWYVDKKLVPDQITKVFRFKPVNESDKEYRIKVQARHKRLGIKESSVIIKVRSIYSRDLHNQVDNSLLLLDSYIKKHSGAKPAVIKSYPVYYKRTTGMYAVFEDDPWYLRNGGATTNSTQVSFLNYISLRQFFIKNFIPPEQAFDFIRYFMMPHDGYSSSQLPDSNMGFDDVRVKFLMHWLLQMEGQDQLKNPLQGDSLFPYSLTLYEIFNPANNNRGVSAIALGKNGLPDLSLKHADPSNTFSFSSGIYPEQQTALALIYCLFNNSRYYPDLENIKKTLITCLVRKGRFPYTTIYNRAWGKNMKDNNSWISDNDLICLPFQSPDIWNLLNEPLVSNCQEMLFDYSQKAYAQFYGWEGLFFPLFDPEKGIVKWGNSGMNINLMEHQYMIFTSLCTYYYLTGSKTSLDMILKFKSFIAPYLTAANSLNPLPYSINTGEKDAVGETVLLADIGKINSLSYSPSNCAILLKGFVMLFLATDNREYYDYACILAKSIMANQGPDGDYSKGSIRYNAVQTDAGLSLMFFQMACYDQFNGFLNFLKSRVKSFFPVMVTGIKDNEKQDDKNGGKYIPLIGNKSFYLSNGDIYVFKGAVINVNDLENYFTLTWNGRDWQGAGHTYDGSSWNGAPVKLQSFNSIYLNLQSINGSTKDIKFEINKIEVVAFDNLIEGKNFIDLNMLRNQFPGQFDLMSSISFVARLGSEGCVNIRIMIE